MPRAGRRSSCSSSTTAALWVGAGSDHTDREVEKYGVSVSKQMCDKPIAPEFWPIVEVAPHWDKLVLRAYILENGERTLYQEGPVTRDARSADADRAIRRQETSSQEGTLMFCGTLAAHGGVRPSDDFRVRARRSRCWRERFSIDYRTQALPVLG